MEIDAGIREAEFERQRRLEYRTTWQDVYQYADAVK